MRSLLLNLLLLIAGFSSSLAASPFTRGVTSSALFGIRAGGLFGGKDEKK
jgi:hypothetical protein